MSFLNIMFTCEIFEQMQRFDPSAEFCGCVGGGATQLVPKSDVNMSCHENRCK